MTPLEIADRLAATALTLSILVFALQYGLRAPWTRSFEGIVIEGTMISFFFIMLNLLGRLYFNWVYYQQGLAITMMIGAIFMIQQNIVLLRARRKVRREEGQHGKLPL